MEIEIEICLPREELPAEVQIDLLARLAVQMIHICGERPREAILRLLTAATVTLIREAGPGESVALELKDLLVEAMQAARLITKPPPRTGN